MLKITEHQGRGNKNLDRESDLKTNYLRWLNPKGKILMVSLGLFFLLFFHPINITSKIIEIEETQPKKEVLSKESIVGLDYTLHKEVENYIKDNSFGSKLKATKLIEECYTQKFDIILALSQGQVESNFGTKGIATRTGSVFNVGTFDDGTILYRYKDPNSSIAPYVHLVKNRYMADVKTSWDLLQPKSFIHYYKKRRYASHKRYEFMVRGVYEKIVSETPIDSLWKAQYNEEVITARKFWRDVDCLQELMDSKI
jgi:hypothetical protein